MLQVSVTSSEYALECCEDVVGQGVVEIVRHRALPFEESQLEARLRPG
jgi:hypothetical protein